MDEPPGHINHSFSLASYSDRVEPETFDRHVQETNRFQRRSKVSADHDDETIRKGRKDATMVNELEPDCRPWSKRIKLVSALIGHATLPYLSKNSSSRESNNTAGSSSIEARISRKINDG